MLNEKDWIPIKDGLPEKNGAYLCTVNCLGKNLVQTVNFANNLNKIDPFNFFEYNRAGWYDHDSEYGDYEVEDVVAWMELPKPYKVESEE